MGEIQSCLQCDAKREPKGANPEQRRTPATPTAPIFNKGRPVSANAASASNVTNQGPGQPPSTGSAEIRAAAGHAEIRATRSFSRSGSSHSSRQPSPTRRENEAAAYEKAKVGIGVYFQRSKEDEGALVVKSILKGSPSQLSNKVFVGDTILAVNGESVYGKTLAELAEKLLGPSGTLVECTFQNGVTREVTTLSLPRGISADRFAQAYLASA